MSEYARMVAGIYLLYLRKSRADNPDESVEEVLAKHEAILQEYAERELGYRIPEEDIYREVVSGESIEDRIEIKKVLSRMEDPNVKGIIVVDPQRLSRGDLEDCGKLISDLRYTQTLVVTPMMTYDMRNKMERRFFQDELLRGRDYLEYTKEILMRGRVASVKRGCYIGSVAPYGYDKVKIGKDCTLEPNKDADMVKMIFDMYVNKWMTPFAISKELNNLGFLSPKGCQWDRGVIRNILTNPHYTGKVAFMRRPSQIKIVDGEKVETRSAKPLNEIILVEGKHPPLVSQEMFDKAQERFASHPRVKSDRQLRNPFAGLLYCAVCGRALRLKPKATGWSSFACTENLCCKGAEEKTLIETITRALEYSELPNLEAKMKNGDGDSIEIKKGLIKTLEKQMDEYREQEENQYELLETKKYTQELFDRRNAALRLKMDKCKEQLDEVRKSMPEAVDYQEKILNLKEAISALKNPEVSAKETNRLLKTIVDRIEYSSPKGQPQGINNFSLSITLRI